MTAKDIKAEARKKLALNMHQAIIIYTVEFAVIITLVALVVMSAVGFGANRAAAVVMICYGSLLGVIALVMCGMVNFAMIDFYLASYRCKPYNVRRLGETLARGGITKIFVVSLKRTLLGLLLLLCLIVPGVIYLIRTSMANYLLIANPKMKAGAVLSASNKVMSGKTGTYFMLNVSLLGWYVLGIVTLGLGFIFILPYINLVKAVYYKRNLQGDKNEYVVPPQPVSPMPGVTETVQQPVARQQSPAANRVVTPQPAAAPSEPAPIDTLDADDVMDMNAAMRDFGSPEVVRDVPEVPIAPPVGARSQSSPAEPVIEPMIEPIVEQEAESEIVETERTLSAEELGAAERARREAIAGIYGRAAPKKTNVNYFEPPKQSPDDFVTSEVEADESFDEFLRDFKRAVSEEIPEQDAQSAAPPPIPEVTEVPQTPPPFERADVPPPDRARERSSRVTRSAERSARTSERGTADRHADRNELHERAERLRREREERLKRTKPNE